MNNKVKVILAILGATDLVWSFFIPIAVALLVITNFTALTTFQKSLIIVAGSVSSLYRGLSVGFIRKNG